MKTISRYIMTLALLLTAVTGAWASGEIVVTVTAADLQADLSNPFTKDGVTIKCSDRMTGGLAFNELNEMSTTLGYFTKIEITNQFPEGISGINGVNGFSVNGSVATWTGKASSVGLGNYSVGPVEQFVFTIEPAIDVTPVTGKTNEWTFTMPAYDVEIAPIYAPVAQWAKVDNVDQLPTAIEGIYAGTEDAIVNAGTVAKTGDNVQGTAMYFATTDAEMTAEKAATANGWLATVPTAAGYDGATTVYVWYYIKGADTPEGQEATAENTFNDSEICATPITVTVLSNKFDIQFKAANDNTIEAGKATVTVKTGDGEAVDKTTDIDAEHKLKGVKMGSEVKLKAATGYKFRKVEVKKGAPAGPVTYTELKGGEVLHVGDIITPTEQVEINGEFYIIPSSSPYTVIRANITGDPTDPLVTPADDGAYYVLMSKSNSYYFDNKSLPVTNKSDGILVTYNEIKWGYKQYTFSVHEP